MENRVIDLHTHTFRSDGQLVPAEHVRRAFVKGYGVIAITDHADMSNLNYLIDGIVEFANYHNKIHANDIAVVPGIELTHIPPDMIADMVKMARKRAKILIVGHGETIFEPVEAGTNRAYIEAGVDILAHPGVIDEDDVKLAAQNGVALEISLRRGSSLTNGYVAKLGIKYGAKLVINTDAHTSGDMANYDTMFKTGIGSGLTGEEVLECFKNSYNIAKKILGSILQ